ncbi:hypothetical protein ACSQ67_008983 [Phaseolus vulgaris]
MVVWYAGVKPASHDLMTRCDCWIDVEAGVESWMLGEYVGPMRKSVLNADRWERQSDVTSVIEWGCSRNSFGGVLGVLQIISRTCVMLGVMRSRVLGLHKRLCLEVRALE